MSYDQRTGEIMRPRNSDADLPEQFRLAGVEWAKSDGDARRLEKIAKRTFAQIIINSDAKSVARAEYEARVSPVYELAEMTAEQAATDANIAKAEMEAVRLRIEVWRSLESSRRAEMGLR